MDYHHTCLVVSDTEASLALYRDVMDFRIVVDTTIPEGDSGGYFDQRTLDDIFDVDGANSRLVLLASRTGALLELEEPRVPAVQKTPREQLRYGYTGISEIAFRITGIDAWFEKIRAAGYETQTDYVWSVAGRARSFLFFDPDGHMIQLVEEPRDRDRSARPKPANG